MSASREKKIRQEQAASGYVSPKEQKAAEERRAQKRSNTLYAAIAVVFVLAAAFIITWNSGIIQRGATAVTIDGKNYSASEMSYFYHDSYNTWTQTYGTYASYFGLDTSKPLDSQVYDEESAQTWADYFCEQGINNLKWTVAAYNESEEKGYEWSEEDENTVTSTIEAIKSYAAQNGTTYKTYLKYIFGSLITPSVYENLLRQQTQANSYANTILDGFTYSESEIADYYAEHTKDFQLVDYDYVNVDGSVPATDENGNTVEVTDEMKAEAMDAAKANAEAILAKVKAGEILETIAKDESYNATFQHIDGMTYSDNDLMNWAFDDSRAAGDNTIIENTQSYTVAVFGARYRNDYNTVNVRHILVNVDESELDTEAETYDADLQAKKDEAKAKADEILNEWKSGAATEDSFAELANKYSEDPGSNTNGGLYEQIYKDSMVPAFNDWIFAEGRKAGDAEVVYAERSNTGSDYKGYHIIYFVGEDAPYWQIQVENTLKNNAYNEWFDTLIASVEATEGSGLKYVKN